jgi:FkbM family methyltransferase
MPMKEKYNIGESDNRNLEYSNKFDRSRVLKYLIDVENPVIFDVGANDGLSLQEFKTCWPDSIVHCFEPQSNCLNLMNKRIRDLSVVDVIVNKVAVGEKHENNVKFYSHDLTTGLSGFNKINIDSSDSIYLNELKNDEEKLKQHYDKLNHENFVSTIRLDDYMRDNQILHVDLLKIDTQGYEPEVLSGLGDSLKDVSVIVTELMFYDYYERSLSFSDIESYLLPAGFSLYDISNISKNPMNGRTDWVDVIYINKKIKK